MKKILTLLNVLFFIVLAQAQPTLEMYESVNGQWQKIENGAMLQRSGDAANEISDVLALKNATSSSKFVFFKKHAVDVLTGSLNTFCWAHTCLLPTQSVSDSMTVRAGELIVDEFSYHYQAKGHAGQSTIRYTAVNFNDHTDTVYFDIVYTTTSAGVANFTMSDIKLAPNPASDKVTVLNLPNHYQEFTIARYDALGGMVSKQILGQGSGGNMVELNVNDLPEGFYFLQINNHQGSVITRRLVVTR